MNDLPASDPGRSLPLAYQFYRGVQLHPRFLGVDVKQWSNCRVGMTGWAVLAANFALASVARNPASAWPGSVVNALLINV